MAKERERAILRNKQQETTTVLGNVDVEAAASAKEKTDQNDAFEELLYGQGYLFGGGTMFGGGATNGGDLDGLRLKMGLRAHEDEFVGDFGDDGWDFGNASGGNRRRKPPTSDRMRMEEKSFANSAAYVGANQTGGLMGAEEEEDGFPSATGFFPGKIPTRRSTGAAVSRKSHRDDRSSRRSSLAGGDSSDASNPEASTVRSTSDFAWAFKEEFFPCVFSPTHSEEFFDRTEHILFPLYSVKKIIAEETESNTGVTKLDFDLVQTEEKSTVEVKLNSFSATNIACILRRLQRDMCLDSRGRLMTGGGIGSKVRGAANSGSRHKIVSRLAVEHCNLGDVFVKIASLDEGDRAALSGEEDEEVRSVVFSRQATEDGIVGDAGGDSSSDGVLVVAAASAVENYKAERLGEKSSAEERKEAGGRCGAVQRCFKKSSGKTGAVTEHKERSVVQERSTSSRSKTVRGEVSTVRETEKKSSKYTSKTTDASCDRRRRDDGGWAGERGTGVRDERSCAENDFTGRTRQDGRASKNQWDAEQEVSSQRRGSNQRFSVRSDRPPVLGTDEFGRDVLFESEARPSLRFAAALPDSENSDVDLLGNSYANAVAASSRRSARHSSRNSVVVVGRRVSSSARNQSGSFRQQQEQGQQAVVSRSPTTSERNAIASKARRDQLLSSEESQRSLALAPGTNLMSRSRKGSREHPPAEQGVVQQNKSGNRNKETIVSRKATALARTKTLARSLMKKKKSSEGGGGANNKCFVSRWCSKILDRPNGWILCALMTQRWLLLRRDFRALFLAVLCPVFFLWLGCHVYYTRMHHAVAVSSVDEQQEDLHTLLNFSQKGSEEDPRDVAYWKRLCESGEFLWAFVGVTGGGASAEEVAAESLLRTLRGTSGFEDCRVSMAATTSRVGPSGDHDHVDAPTAALTAPMVVEGAAALGSVATEIAAVVRQTVVGTTVPGATTEQDIVASSPPPDPVAPPGAPGGADLSPEDAAVKFYSVMFPADGASQASHPASARMISAGACSAKVGVLFVDDQPSIFYSDEGLAKKLLVFRSATLFSGVQPKAPAAFSSTVVGSTPTSEQVTTPTTFDPITALLGTVVGPPPTIVSTVERPPSTSPLPSITLTAKQLGNTATGVTQRIKKLCRTAKPNPLAKAGVARWLGGPDQQCRFVPNPHSAEEAETMWTSFRRYAVENVLYMVGFVGPVFTFMSVVVASRLENEIGSKTKLHVLLTGISQMQYAVGNYIFDFLCFSLLFAAFMILLTLYGLDFYGNVFTWYGFSSASLFLLYLLAALFSVYTLSTLKNEVWSRLIRRLARCCGFHYSGSTSNGGAATGRSRGVLFVLFVFVLHMLVSGWLAFRCLHWHDDAVRGYLRSLGSAQASWAEGRDKVRRFFVHSFLLPTTQN